VLLKGLVQERSRARRRSKGHAILIESRACAVCRPEYSRSQQFAEPAWEGWRCPTCSRTRHRELHRQALILIEQTEQPWRLISELSDTDPDVLETVREMLLAPGGLTRAEGVALRDAVLSDPA
jgi:hypothetical protein